MSAQLGQQFKELYLRSDSAQQQVLRRLMDKQYHKPLVDYIMLEIVRARPDEHGHYGYRDIFRSEEIFSQFKDQLLFQEPVIKAFHESIGYQRDDQMTTEEVASPEMASRLLDVVATILNEDEHMHDVVDIFFEYIAVYAVRRHGIGAMDADEFSSYVDNANIHYADVVAQLNQEYRGVITEVIQAFPEYHDAIQQRFQDRNVELQERAILLKHELLGSTSALQPDSEVKAHRRRNRLN